VFEWIEGLLDKDYRLVVTSRPILQLPERLASRMATYSIAPLSEEEQTQLVSNLLGSKAVAFRAASTHASARWMLDNPLLLSLAALVFDRDETLPRRRVDLYHEVVNQCLGNAEGRRIREELPADLMTVIEPALWSLAFAMTDDPHLVRVQDILPAFAERIAAITKQPREYELPGVGGLIIRALGRHTGFFQVLGDNCGWMHAGFREYFAARYLFARSAHDDSQRAYFERANDAAWRHVLLMLLSLMSDRHPVDAELSSLAESGAEGNLFAAQALLEGIRVSQVTAEKTTELLARFTLEDSPDYWARPEEGPPARFGVVRRRPALRCADALAEGLAGRLLPSRTRA
jgi:hypothetical protein